MKITLTNITLALVPTINQVIHLFWKISGEPDIDYRTLPDATVNPSGLIISPSPYEFDTEGTIGEDIVVKAVNACNAAFTVTKLIPGLDCCPITYTMSDDETYCLKVNTTAATPPSNPTNTEESNLNVYDTYGTLIYDAGFNINGTGPFTQIPYINSFWVNGPGYPTTIGNTTNGPLNRAGLWSVGGGYPGQIVGFTVCVTVPSSTTYLVGLSADNSGRISVDGNVIVDQDYTAMGIYLSANGYPAATTDSPFRFWHVYPIALTAGNHIIEVVGVNEPFTPFPNPGAVGIEIYNATPAELIASTSYVDLGAKLIFSSKDYIGQPIQVGSEGFGYTCTSGYSLVLCDGPAYCKQVLTTSPIQC